MSQIRGTRRNLWSLTVLCLLRVKPMHPYEMQRLIRDWHKDEFLDLKRGSLYHAIERLRKAGLIDPIETSREGRRPERTVYQLTEAGERHVCEWLKQLLAVPMREPTQFFAARDRSSTARGANGTSQVGNRQPQDGSRNNGAEDRPAGFGGS